MIDVTKFASKKEMFNYVVKNKSLLLAQKKAETKCKFVGNGFYDDNKKSIIKNPFKNDSEFIYPVISNTNYMDSYWDVHLNNSMNKTASDQSGKIYYVADHELKTDQVIAMPKDVEISIKEMTWNELGRTYSGTTQAMLFKVEKENIVHEKFRALLNKGNRYENSIRMRYLKLDVGVNDKDYEDEYKVWKEVYPLIANKEFADEVGMFYAIRELQIVMEGSAVLFGANDATQIKATVLDIAEQKSRQEDTRLIEALKELNVKLKIN